MEQLCFNRTIVERDSESFLRSVAGISVRQTIGSADVTRCLVLAASNSQHRRYLASLAIKS